MQPASPTLDGETASRFAALALANIAREAFAVHVDAGFTGLASAAFVGAHWLASFAVLALDG